MTIQYVNPQHESIQKVISQLQLRGMSEVEKLKRIHQYVRDHIQFGFLPEADFVSAAEVVNRGMDQCNNKAILFHTLCKAVGIPSRLHYSGISKAIQRGLFTGFLYKIMPAEISHSWVEVEVEGNWVRIDTFINDITFYRGGKARLQAEGEKTGYSVSCEAGESSPSLDLNGEKFVQMGAVTDDHGIYDNPAQYFASSLYNNRPNPVKMWLYRRALGGINRRVEQVRQEGRAQ